MSAPAVLKLSARDSLEFEVERTAADAAREDPIARPFPTVQVMVGEAPTPPSVHVARLVLDRDINLWTGHGGSAKSVLLFVIAVSVALGRAVFGTLGVLRAGVVLLVLPEDGQIGARMMLDAIAAGMDLNEADHERLGTNLVMVSDEVMVNITRDARRLRDTAVAHGAVLVIFDPLRNLLGDRPENDNDVAGAALDAIRREVCRSADATVIISQHDRKPGKDALADTAASPHDVRGAGGWVNGSRLVFSVKKRDSRITLTATKSNRLRADLRHELDLAILADPDNEAHWLSCRVTDANIGATSVSLTPGVGRSVNENERKALDALSDRHEPGRRVAWSAWVGTTGLKGDTLKSIKTRLLDAGLAEALPAGQHRNGGKLYNYAITESGRSALDTGWVVMASKGERVR